jgi:soluble P-type ATPase
MIEIEIPGSDTLKLEHFVTDFSGTLSEDGIVLPGVREKLQELSKKLDIHVLTSDTFGRAREELKGLDCRIQVLEGDGHTAQKEKYVLSLGAQKVVAVGNGNNDVLMLRAARLSIAVCLKEGCSVKAAEASRVLVLSPVDAIDLLLFPKRLAATLRI